MNGKKLYRSDRDIKLAGVCSGIAEYAGIDPTVMRLLVVGLIILSGIFPGLLAYVIAAIIIPKKSEEQS